MAKAPAKGGKKKSFKKKEKRVVHTGVVHIQATFNNTIVTIADGEGNTISWSSAGSLGFRGSRKGTPFAAQQAALTAANKATEVGLRSVEVRVSGPGSGRESASFAHCPPPASTSAPSATPPPSPTTDAGRLKSAACFFPSSHRQRAVTFFAAAVFLPVASSFDCRLFRRPPLPNRDCEGAAR